MNDAEKKQHEYLNETATRVENRYDVLKKRKMMLSLKKRSYC